MTSVREEGFRSRLSDTCPIYTSPTSIYIRPNVITHKLRRWGRLTSTQGDGANALAAREGAHGLIERSSKASASPREAHRGRLQNERKMRRYLLSLLHRPLDLLIQPSRCGSARLTLLEEVLFFGREERRVNAPAKTSTADAEGVAFTPRSNARVEGSG